MIERGLHVLTLTLAVVVSARGQAPNRQAPKLDVLSASEWKQIDNGVDRGLAWLATQQMPDGSFPSYETGQPAVTSLGVMAFLSRGHRPGEGPYAETIDRAIDFVLSQQRGDGLLFGASTDMPATEWGEGSHTAMYNHAISGLMLGEAFGMTDGERTKKIRLAMTKAIEFARRMQRRPSSYEVDKYGWRYYKHLDTPPKGEADLSVTGWFVMFYRSAKNADFDIPEQYVNEAIQFVKGCYDEEHGLFFYGPTQSDHRASRAMTGAGLLCLTIAGVRDEKITAAGGQWILEHPFTTYNNTRRSHDRYHYGAYYCSQAMFMIGGDSWRQFYPPMAMTMVANQSPQGDWAPESAQNDRVFGNCYTTALAILSLTPPYQLLPIYQR